MLIDQKLAPRVSSTRQRCYNVTLDHIERPHLHINEIYLCTSSFIVVWVTTLIFYFWQIVLGISAINDKYRHLEESIFNKTISMESIYENNGHQVIRFAESVAICIIE